MELVIASSSGDSSTVSCWELQTGAQRLRHSSCSSTPHGLACVGERFLASSQLPKNNATFGSVFYWSWDKAQPEVKSFPAEPIGPLVANSEGTYIVGGGISGKIYVWEVATGMLLRKWHAHLGSVTCLVFSEDDSLLISGSDGGSVRVWSLFMLFDEIWTREATHLYEHDFIGHSRRVTDVVLGFGGCSALIVSASEDRTCKVWSLSTGALLRSIEFPSPINAIALDPGDRVFYAGDTDGKIHIAALHVESTSSNGSRTHIIDSLPEQRNAITCLAYSATEDLLISGSKDGMVRVWDPRSGTVVRIFKHTGQVNNVLIARKHPSLEQRISNVNPSKGQKLAPALEKYMSSTDNDEVSIPSVIVRLPGTRSQSQDVSYMSCDVLDKQIKELRQQTSEGSVQLEVEKLKAELGKAVAVNQKLKQMNGNLLQFCSEELLEGKTSKTKKTKI